MFKKILVPTDGSDVAIRAAEIVAAQAALTPGAHVTIVAAIAPRDINHSDLDAEVLKRQNERMHHRAEDVLHTVAAIFERHGVAHTEKVIVGDPVSSTVAEEAQAGDYDLIAMCSRGLGMSRDDARYVGSVTEHIIRRVNIPVLVIPIHGT